MATKFWIGGAGTAVAQVHTGSIDTVDGTPANNTFTVTIGGVAVSAVGDTDVATTATNLRTALNASTHPYFSTITWSGATGDIIGTADTAGVPFVAALTVSGGGSGTVTDFAATTANAGPNDWATAANWSDNTVPVDSDIVYFRNGSNGVFWGLDQNGVTLTELHIEQTYTGKIGLRDFEFATSADGATVNANYAEYRQSYLKVQCTIAHIGAHLGPGSPVGSSRVKLHNNETTASEIIVHNTHASGESNVPAVQLLADDADVDLFIRRCPGAVGIAIGKAGETATLGDISIETDQINDELYIGEGVTYTNLFQEGGSVTARGAATVTKVEVNDGECTLELDQLVTTLEVNGGECFSNNVPAAGAAVTNLNVNGGTVDFTRSNRPRTVTTVTLADGATLAYDSGVMTFTNDLATPTGKRTVQVT